MQRARVVLPEPDSPTHCRAGLRVDVKVYVEEHALARIGRFYTAQHEHRLARPGEHGWQSRPARVGLLLDVACQAADLPITDGDRNGPVNKAITKGVRTPGCKSAALRLSARTRWLALDPRQHLCPLG